MRARLACHGTALYCTPRRRARELFVLRMRTLAIQYPDPWGKSAIPNKENSPPCPGWGEVEANIDRCIIITYNYTSHRLHWCRCRASFVPQTLLLSNIAYIELFQRNTIIVNVSISKGQSLEVTTASDHLSQHICLSPGYKIVMV